MCEAVLTQTLQSSLPGRIASQLVEVINSGKRDRIESFLGSSISENGKRTRSRADSLALLWKAYEQSGGVDFRRIERSEPNPFVFYVASRRGDHWSKIYLFMDKIELDKISEFGFLPARDPLAVEQLPWPEKRLEENRAVMEIQKHVERAGQKDTFSGVVMVARESTPILNIAVGFADRTFKVSNGIDTKFNIGSINKMFTGLAIAQLVEKNEISLTDRLCDLIPAYPNGEAAKSTTIYHLLSHQAGLGGLFERPKYDKRMKYRTNMEILPIFADQELLFEPGSRSMYSNEGYIVLGAIIEEVTRDDYHDYIRKNITDPAGMENTGPFALDESTPNLAVGYMQYEDDPFGLDPRHPNYMFLGWRGNACGGGYSTAQDLLKFANALKSYEFVGRDLTELFASRKVKMRNYGLGFEVEDFNGNKVVGHTGGGPNSGVNCALKIFWNTDETVIALGNYDAPAAQDLASDIAKFLSS